MSSCTGKSRALRAPAKAPSFGSSISRPITSQTPTFTPFSLTGPSSSRCDSMKKRGRSGGGLGVGATGDCISDTVIGETASSSAGILVTPGLVIR